MKTTSLFFIAMLSFSLLAFPTTAYATSVQDSVSEKTAIQTASAPAKNRAVFYGKTVIALPAVIEGFSESEIPNLRNTIKSAIKAGISRYSILTFLQDTKTENDALTLLQYTGIPGNREKASRTAIAEKAPLAMLCTLHNKNETYTLIITLIDVLSGEHLSSTKLTIPYEERSWAFSSSNMENAVYTICKNINIEKLR